MVIFVMNSKKLNGMNNAQPQINALRESFDKIYVSYFSRMLRFAKEYVVFEEDAENIVQDVFVMLWEKRDVLDIQVNLISYMFMLVKNRCLDYIRHQAVADEYKQEQKAKLAALEELDYTFSSEEELEEIIHEAIDKLPERCREVFLKSRVEGMKNKEIAKELNISVNTVNSQIVVALKRLRIELKDYLSLFFFLV